MEIGVMLFVIAGLIAAIWILIEIKGLRHKLFAVFLIALILFGYVGLKDKDINYWSISGLTSASKIGLSWLGGVYDNFKSLTSYAVNQNWESSEAEENSSKK